MMQNNPFSLENKTILVTGASSGIGKAIAIACSRMGATVVITGRNEQRLQETFNMLDGTGRNHVQIKAELTDDESLSELVSRCPKLTGLVLCAGISAVSPMQFSTKDKFQQVLDVNFLAPVELFRLLYKKKLIEKEASVVMITSIGGVRSVTLGNGMYGASKSALNTTMKFFAKEFGPSRKVRVNSICPGMVDTPLIQGGTFTEEQREEDIKRYPLGRYGRPEDIAYGAVYLLSDASAWMTGQEMVIDGGFSI